MLRGRDGSSRRALRPHGVAERGYDKNAVRAGILGLRSTLGSPRMRIVLLIALLLVTVAVASVPTTTNILVNYRPEPVTQPLYAKAISFLDRDIQMRQLAWRIVGDTRDESERADRILRWTNANVRPRPAGLPAVDDHPYNTIVRGYGDVDQAADAFANLAAYAGLPGGLVLSRGRDGSMLYAFAVLEIAGVERLFDVREGLAFRDRTGDLASVDALRKDRSLLSGLPLPREARGLSYVALVEGLDAGPHRRPTDQMPLSRLVNEVKRLLRVQ